MSTKLAKRILRALELECAHLRRANTVLQLENDMMRAVLAAHHQRKSNHFITDDEDLL